MLRLFRSEKLHDDFTSFLAKLPSEQVKSTYFLKKSFIFKHSRPVENFQNPQKFSTGKAACQAISNIFQCFMQNVRISIEKQRKKIFLTAFFRPKPPPPLLAFVKNRFLLYTGKRRQPKQSRPKQGKNCKA